MSDTTFAELPVVLKNTDHSTTSATIQFEIQGSSVVRIRGLDAAGDEKYQVSFILRKDGDDGCFVCLDPPCPPNPLKFVTPCPD